MARKKAQVEVDEAVDAPEAETVEPAVEETVTVSTVGELEKSLAVQLRDGSTKIGLRKMINGHEHVEVSENGITYLVHKSPNGDWFEV